ncbi:hypothetical protein GIB67_033089 [Kingdonia uniflora]|uniref:Uncharacterized protein n=1 Tax=Kingdonia uniflora TaxID=39325 RepID=A0A7J7MYK3_9MAGN|nr:hypothetical protein GIB67_033089 [Kingdonia uniflora]
MEFVSAAIFQRYPRPEKEYQSFSLIYNDRSLDLICKDKEEAEVWFVGLSALVSRSNYRKSDKASSDSSSSLNQRSSLLLDRNSSDSSSFHSQKSSPIVSPSGSSNTIQKDLGDTHHYDILPHKGFGKAFSDVILYSAASRQSVVTSVSSVTSRVANKFSVPRSTADSSRGSFSSALSSSSLGSRRDDFDALGDVFIWGEGFSDRGFGGKIDELLPKSLESPVVLDVQNIACGDKHAILVTKQGKVFSWGEESGGRLGHGVEADFFHPKLIDTISGLNVGKVACGEFHTCALTLSGDLYSWGDGTHNSGLLGHGSEVSHWIPKMVSGLLEGIHISSISCGPWHTAVISSTGQLFTFGDGTFGALGHGDRISTSMPREVESLTGHRTVRVACGVWHTAAIIESMFGVSSTSDDSSPGRLFTWGDGDKGRLGHGDKDPRLGPACVAALLDISFCQVSCGHNVTVALTTLGRVYTMGQLGSYEAVEKVPTCIEGEISNSLIQEISCGSYHIAVLTSKGEVYTWGKGANGRLGHGDNDDRSYPTLVEALKDKQVKSVVCGSNVTAVICLHKWQSSADNSTCSGCHNLFGFRRKRHNCYNCGSVFCKSCSRRKALKSALAPNPSKAYRVCEDCFTKLSKAALSPTSRFAASPSVTIDHTPDFRSGQLSRFSAAESAKQAKSGIPRLHWRRESDDNDVSSQWGNFYSSKWSNSGSSKKIFSSSVPGSRVASRATSPVSRKPSPTRSSTETTIPSVLTSPSVILHTNDDLAGENIKLRAKVEDLSCRSKLLEAELRKTSAELERRTRQFEEATAMARDENSKCKAGKEVIKSLTAQLNYMADTAPKGSVSSSMSISTTENFSSSHSVISIDHTFSSLTSSELDSNRNSAAEPGSNRNSAASPLIFNNGAKVQIEQPAEWIIPDEPGVYLTLSSLPGGGKKLGRIRFSSKCFNPEQAERWWLENREKLHKRHNVKNVELPISGASLQH